MRRHMINIHNIDFYSNNVINAGVSSFLVMTIHRARQIQNHDGLFLGSLLLRDIFLEVC